MKYLSTEGNLTSSTHSQLGQKTADGERKGGSKWSKMLTFGQSVWNLFRNYLDCYCNFSKSEMISKKVFFNSGKKEERKAEKKLPSILFLSYKVCSGHLSCFVCLFGFIHLHRLILSVKVDLSSEGKVCSQIFEANLAIKHLKIFHKQIWIASMSNLTYRSEDFRNLDNVRISQG